MSSGSSNMIIYSRVLILELLFSVVFNGFKRYSYQTLYLIKKFLKIEMPSRSFEVYISTTGNSSNNNRGFSYCTGTAVGICFYLITMYTPEYTPEQFCLYIWIYHN